MPSKAPEVEKPPNLQSIAQALGIHKSTVSRALKGSHLVSEDLRATIFAEAKRIGYQPDPQAARLAERRWGGGARAKSVACAYLTEREISHPREQNRMKLLPGWAAEMGYQLQYIHIRQDSSARAVAREMRAKGVQTVITSVFSSAKSRSIFESKDFPWERYPWVAINEATVRVPIHRVIFNTYAETRDCLNRIYEHGYRRIAFVASPETNAAPVERQEAAMLSFIARHPSAGLTRIPFESFLNKSTQEQLAESVDCLLFSYFEAAKSRLPVLNHLPYASLKIWPEFIGHTAGMELAEEELCRSAIDLMDMLFRRGSVGIPKLRHTLAISCHWRDGTSLPLKDSSSR